MTRDELRIKTFEELLGHIAENYVSRVLQTALDHTNNDPDAAIQWCIDHEIAPPVQGGHCGPDIEWQHWGGWRSKGEAWEPPHHSWNSPPDITFTYKDILVYILNGKPKDIQLEMF